MSAIYLKAIDPTGGPERLEIPEGRAETDVGRSADCGIVLPSKSVSRVHARFRRRGAELVIEDLGSSNGTAVNGTRIHAAVTVRPGDRIRFGSLEFLLEETAAAEDEAETLLAPAAPPNPPAAPASTATADALPSASPPSAATATQAPAEAPVAPPTVRATPPPQPAPATAPEPPRIEPTARTFAQEPKAPQRSSAGRDDPSALELALIAAAAYLAVIAVGFALRWFLG